MSLFRSDHQMAKAEGAKEENPQDLSNQEPKVAFHCQRCGLAEEADFFGVKPPFCRKVAHFSAPSFVLRDPLLA